jgi:alpha-tubulin suppressor-like RCC1 family protein
MLGVVVLTLLMSAATWGCTPNPSRIITLDVRSDYAPSRDFDRVTYVLSGGVGVDGERAVRAGDDFLGGVRVTEFSLDSEGTYELRVQLERGRRVVRTRRVRLPLRPEDPSVVSVSVVFSRACETVMCPGAGAPQATECEGGTCILPECLSPLDPRPGCRAFECDEASPCPASSGCAVRECVGGRCLGRSVGCSASEVCDPELGCRSVTPTDDAGVTDGGGVDAGTEDAGSADDAGSGPIGDAGGPTDDLGSLLDFGGGDSEAPGDGAVDSGASEPDGGVDADGGMEPIDGGDDAGAAGPGDACAGRLCGGECVDVRADRRHCGSCGRRCGPFEMCSLGMCRTPLGTEALGFQFTCAVRADATVRCWGSNGYGQLGDGTLVDSTTPVRVEGLDRVVGITAGFWHVCALRDDGTAWCWGRNDSRQVDAGAATYRTSPVRIDGLSDLVDLAAGYYHTCALRTDGRVFCWGNNTYGQLGRPMSPVITPTEVADLEIVADIASKDSHNCATLGTGEVVCWGYNAYGQIGDGTLVDAFSVFRVPEIHDAIAVATGHYFTCAVRAEGDRVTCWGDDRQLQLGSETPAASRPPQDLAGLGRVSSLALGAEHGCALLQTGRVACWGGNLAGVRGDAESGARGSPREVLGIDDAGRVGAGSYHMCFRNATGGIACWGRNSGGELGSGDRTGSASPRGVVGW